MLKLDPSRQAAKFLRRLGAPKHQKQIARKILALRQDPYPQDAKQLKGFSFWRADAGEYRIIYEVEGDTLTLVLVGKRNGDEVYRKLKRRGK